VQAGVGGRKACEMGASEIGNGCGKRWKGVDVGAPLWVGTRASTEGEFHGP
jgi:hypothetical protein